ncbi:hypothetical protein GCM10022239_05580 [Leifsonia bigeumensis]|uniref:Flavin reductase like domain-containing protein n=1 Tax=Leifsonella bigeumensis TaxID=433643 RepID=A0ABP7F6B6_9MICO
MNLTSPEVIANPGLERPAWHRHLQSSLGRFVTGAAVITAEGDQGPVGTLVGSFTSVSKEPPLVLVPVGKSTIVHDAMRGRPFVINVLGAEHRSLAAHFRGQCGSEPSWVAGEYAPRLRGMLAHFECTEWADYDLGDRTLYVGRVEDFDYRQGDALGMEGDRFVSVPEWFLGRTEPGRVDLG